MSKREYTYRRTGNLVVACIGLPLCVVVAVAILVANAADGDLSFWDCAGPTLMALWALDHVDTIRTELNRPPRPAGLPLPNGDRTDASS